MVLALTFGSEQTNTRLSVQVGDLIEFTNNEQPKENDIGTVVNIAGRRVTILWAKDGTVGYSTIDRLLCEKDYFEIIENNS
jgi:hypothetical protein